MAQVQVLPGPLRCRFVSSTTTGLVTTNDSLTSWSTCLRTRLPCAPIERGRRCGHRCPYRGGAGLLVVKCSSASQERKGHHSPILTAMAGKMTRTNRETLLSWSDAPRNDLANRGRRLNDGPGECRAKTFERTGLGAPQTHSRTSVLQRLLSHEAYHCGELSQTLGVAGLRQIDLWGPEGLVREPGQYG